eukprot:488373-Rhodomonas_salina.3
MEREHGGLRDGTLLSPPSSPTLFLSPRISPIWPYLPPLPPPPLHDPPVLYPHCSGSFSLDRYLLGEESGPSQVPFRPACDARETALSSCLRQTSDAPHRQGLSSGLQDFILYRKVQIRQFCAPKPARPFTCNVAQKLLRARGSGRGSPRIR